MDAYERSQLADALKALPSRNIQKIWTRWRVG